MIVLYLAAVLAGFFAFVLPGIFVAVNWYFVAQAVVVDDRRGVAALARSGELVRGNWRRALADRTGLQPGRRDPVDARQRRLRRAARAVNAEAVIVLGDIVYQAFALPFVAIGATLFYLRLRDLPRPVIARACQRPAGGRYGGSVQALPLVTAMFAAFLIAPAALRTLAAGPLARENYRGRVLACPLGIVIVAAAVLALAPLAVAQQLATSTVVRPELGWVAVYVLGVALLGLADDVLADRARGWRGHGAAALRGEFGTGALKAAGSAGLALYVMAQPGVGTARFVLGCGGPRAGDQRLQPARPAAGPGGQGVRRAGRRADARQRPARARCGRSACSPARSSSSGSTTCASSACSATPDPTSSGRSPAPGWCSASRIVGLAIARRGAGRDDGLRRVPLDLGADRADAGTS